MYQSEQEKRVIPWFKDNGDRVLRLDYSLSKDSIVFDIGGYEGNWTSDIFSMYQCNIYVFEPVSSFYKAICKRFEFNDKIKVFNFGLSDKYGEIEISINADSSSIFKKVGNTGYLEIIKLKQFKGFIEENNINKIDLLKINIEGGEYDLMEHIIEQNIQSKIRNFQIQFHDFVPNAKIRMDNIKQKLSKSHYLTYEYPFVWENWRLE